MKEYLPLLALFAVVGSGLVSGLFFAFSNFVMQALLELPAEFGQQAMQRVNVRIINPLFLFVFMGTAVVCAAVAFLSAVHSQDPGAGWLLAGAVVYLVGAFGVTMAFNVPLNNALAGVPTREAGTAWPAYAQRWLRWNHVRGALAVLATALLGYGLHHLGASQG